MTCDELSADYSRAYALGVASEPERGEITEHLARQCPACVPGVASALATVSAMSAAVEMVEPPARLRRRVTALVAPETATARPARSWMSIALPWAFAGALAIVLVSVAIPGRGNRDTARLEQALTILNDPAAKDVSFGAAPAPARGRVFVSPARGVVFIAANLPKISEGKTFELWVIPAAGNPIPAGTFQSQADSSALYVRSGPVERGAAAVAVTVEPSGGSAQPTSKPFIVAALT